jgi:hypothetical protein
MIPALFSSAQMPGRNSLLNRENLPVLREFPDAETNAAARSNSRSGYSLHFNHRIQGFQQLGPDLFAFAYAFGNL